MIDTAIYFGIQAFFYVTLVSFLTGIGGSGSDGSVDGDGRSLGGINGSKAGPGGKGADNGRRGGTDSSGRGGAGGGGKGEGGRGDKSKSGSGGSKYCDVEKPEKVETADSTPCPSKSYKEEVLRCSCP